MGLMMVPRELGIRRETKLRPISASTRTWYDEHPGAHRPPRLKHGNLTLDGWQELHGPNVKAANTRGVAPLFAYLAGRFLQGDTPAESAARALTSYLEEFCHILCSQPMFMETPANQRIRVVCEEMGYHYPALRAHRRQGVVLASSDKPEAHETHRAPMLCNIITSRRVQCCGEGSLTGTTSNAYVKPMA